MVEALKFENRQNNGYPKKKEATKHWKIRNKKTLSKSKKKN